MYHLKAVHISRLFNGQINLSLNAFTFTHRHLALWPFRILTELVVHSDDGRCLSFHSLGFFIAGDYRVSFQLFKKTQIQENTNFYLQHLNKSQQIFMFYSLRKKIIHKMRA